MNESNVLESKRQIPALFLIYLSALSTGVAWVTLPALSDYLLTGFSFSEAQYGFISSFLNVAAILTAFSVGIFRKKIRLERLWALGVLFVSIGELGIPIASLVKNGHVFLPYGVIILSAILTGIGIALLVSSLNVILISLVPKHKPTALTGMYASISVGGAVTPFMVLYLTKIVSWKIIPLFFSLIGLLIFVLIIISIPQLVKHEKNLSAKIDRFFSRNIKFYGFIVLILFYAFIETSYGYWSPIYLRDKGLDIQFSELSISRFWGFFALGQLISSIALYWISDKKYYFILLIIVFIAVLWTIFVKTHNILLPFGLAGLGCSGLFPLTVHFFEKTFPHAIHTASGLVLGFYFSGVALNTLLISVLIKLYPSTTLHLYSLSLLSILGLLFLSSLLVFNRKSAL